MFVIIEFLLYITFIYLDTIKPECYVFSNYIKFISIIVCFIYAVQYFIRKESRQLHQYYLIAALFFTIISDFCILIKNYDEIGVFFFCLVQLCYLMRIKEMDMKRKSAVQAAKNSLINIIAAGFIISVLCLLNVQIDVLLVLTCIYFTFILHNTIMAVKLIGKGKQRGSADINKIFFGIGMSLFLLCDIHVGLFNLSSYFNLEQYHAGWLYRWASVAMWIFYLPSQVLLVLSGKNYNKK